MHKLVVKIFLWFWLSLLVMGAALLFAQRQWSEAERLPSASAMRAYAAQAESLLQAPRARQLRHWLRELNEDSGGQFFLFDPRGRELSGRWVPPELRRYVLRPPDEAHEHHRAARYVRVQALEVPGRGRYLLVAASTPPAGLSGLPVWARAGIALAVSAVVSLLLAAYFSRPIRRVREATRRFAGGELDARVAPSRSRDEIAELGRDFNAMADRVQGLIESQRRLLRDVSHELRSPLARLHVALELARRQAGGQAAQPLDRIELEAERLNELIGQVLALARLEVGQSERGHAPVALAELLQAVVADAAFEAGAARLRLAAAEEAVVRGDPVLLRSAVENVVRNALRYAPAETVVEVSLAVAEGVAVIAVQDQGAGVPAEELERIFTPFARVSAARERDSGGYGLGLAIARRAVELHGGGVSASNVQPHGLRVELRLPLSA